MKRIIALLAVPGVQLLDVSGPLDVFAEANRILHRQVYEPVVISADDLTVESSSGVKLLATLRLADTDALRSSSPSAASAGCWR